MNFLVKLTATAAGVSQTEYLGIGTYIVNGERYAVLVGSQKSEAKRYSSHFRAKKAFEILSKSCSNLSSSNYAIEEVDK